jgi:hypothetical protein
MPKVTKITVGRLYNLGSYEHIRYEVTVDVPDGESARSAMVGLERIMDALKPEARCAVPTRDSIERDQRHLDDLRKQLETLSCTEFARRNGNFEGTPQEYVLRVAEGVEGSRTRRAAYEARAAKARELLNALGGAAEWRDHKLDWEDTDFDQL